MLHHCAHVRPVCCRETGHVCQHTWNQMQQPVQAVLGSRSQLTCATPSFRALFGADTLTPMPSPPLRAPVCRLLHTQKVTHTSSRVPHTALFYREPDTGSHIPLSLSGGPFHTWGCFSSTKTPQTIQASCLRPTLNKDEDHTFALSRPRRSGWPALLGPRPAGSWGVSESWPRPTREGGSRSSFGGRGKELSST